MRDSSTVRSAGVAARGCRDAGRRFALLVVDAIVGPHLWPTLILFLFTVSGLGLVFANATTLALAEVRAAAGTGSAVLGAAQFALGAVVAPVVGLGGEATAVPMAVTMLASACVAAVALTITRRQRASAATTRAI